MKLWAALTRFLTTVPVLAKGKTRTGRLWSPTSPASTGQRAKDYVAGGRFASRRPSLSGVVKKSRSRTPISSEPR
jgi:hypothetical protein